MQLVTSLECPTQIYPKGTQYFDVYSIQKLGCDCRFFFMFRERNFAKALESAKSRVIQLVSELESTREAQLIVLETKESVMRSLVKQNSQLTIEV